MNYYIVSVAGLSKRDRELLYWPKISVWQARRRRTRSPGLVVEDLMPGYALWGLGLDDPPPAISSRLIRFRESHDAYIMSSMMVGHLIRCSSEDGPTLRVPQNQRGLVSGDRVKFRRDVFQGKTATVREAGPMWCRVEADWLTVPLKVRTELLALYS